MRTTDGASAKPRPRGPRRLLLGVAALGFIALVLPAARAQGAVVANAGPDGTMLVGDTVALNGSASSGTITQYNWAFVSRPSGSRAVISTGTAVLASFVADKTGAYTVRLTVRGGGSTATDTAVFTTINRPPVANAGTDASGVVGARVLFDGRLSTDPDGDRITYSWSVRSAPTHSRRALTNPTAARPSLVLDRPGTYVLELVVADGRTTSVADQVVVTTTNTRPVANAGRDQAVVLGARVTLDGGRSYDVDEQLLTYSWTLRRPTRSAAVLTDPLSVRPTFVPDVAGSYVATLTVSDGTLTHSASTTASTANIRPSARVDSGGQGLAVGAIVQLDGTGSADANGNLLSYSWTLTRPAGSAATISDATAPRPSLTADLAGRYTAALVARDAASASPSVSTVFVTGNKAPVANAGPDQSATVGTVVRLDGSESTDPDGNELGHGWAFVSKPTGSTAVLSAAGDVRPTFLPDLAGTYVLQLIVFDGVALSPADTVVVATLDNLPPVADAGPDQVVTPGTAVTLDGSASSDADLDTLGYKWALTSRPTASAAVLSLAGTPAPVLTPDVPGDYVIQLVVSDGVAASNLDTVVVTTGNARPVASAGADGTVPPGSPVSLDGTASSDANGDALTYAWALVSRPPGSAALLDDPNAATPAFTADRPGVYVAQLVVRDAVSQSLADTVVVTAAVSGNRRPLAVPSAPASVTAGATVQLDGSASSDPDSDPLTFSWTFVSMPAGSGAILQGASSALPTFRADLPGLYKVQLVVNDGSEDSLPVQVSINGNAPPVAIACADTADCPKVRLISPADLPHEVMLRGTDSYDPERCGYPVGDPREKDCLTYEWIFNVWPASDTVHELVEPRSATPHFTATAEGLYVLQLRVNDGLVDSATDIIRIKTANLPPAADAGPDQANVSLNTLVGLVGTASDPDADTLSYEWTFLEKPLGSAANLFAPTSLTPTFLLDVPGRYLVQLAVSDGFATTRDTVQIRTPNRAPTANAGPDRLATINVPITVNGSGADLDGDALTYTWTLVDKPSGSTVTLGNATTASPTFTPDLGGPYTLRLMVNDGTLDSPPDDMIVNATAGSISLELQPSGLLGVGRTTMLRITLTAPAPLGGVVVALSSDNPGIASVSPSSVAIPVGGTSGTATVTAVTAGATVLRASATGYVGASTGVSVTNELITLGAGVSAPVGLVSPLPVSIGPNAAPVDAIVTLVSNPAVLEVLTPTVTIPAGQFSTNASVRGIAGGTASVVATSPAHATAMTNVIITGELRILEPTVTFSPGIPRSIRVQLQSVGSPIIAPPPGLTVTLTAADPTCVTVPATATILAGQTLVRQLLAHTGTSPLPCSTTITASATGLVSGSVGVTVNPPPSITILPPYPYSRRVGAGLQDGAYTARLGVSEHDELAVRIKSTDATKLLVSRDAATPGAEYVDVVVADTRTDATFYVQGLEDQSGDVSVEVKVPGFVDETTVISIVAPAVSFRGTLPATTTSLSPDIPFSASIGPALLDGSDLESVQAIRAGGVARTATVTTSLASVAQLRVLGGVFATAQLAIPVGAAQTASTVATGGVALDPVAGGATTVTASIPGFMSTAASSGTVSVTGQGIAIYSPYYYPAYQIFPRYVGAGLQDGTYWINLEASNHGGVRVRIESSNSAILLVSPDAATAGTPFIEVAIADGQTAATFYVQGLEGHAGDATVTASAPGFSPSTSGIISVVAPGVSLLRSLPSTTTRLSTDTPFRVFIGPALADGSDLINQNGYGYEQAIRAGGVPQTVTVTHSALDVAELKTQAGSADSVTLTIPEQASGTPTTVDTGGVAFDPILGGTTTVTASIPDFVTTTAASQDVTVTAAGMAIYSPYYYPAYQIFPQFLGAGLQDGPYWVALEASDHGGVYVHITSSNAGKVVVSPDATTPGTDFIDLFVPSGQTNVGFYVQGLEGQTGDTTLLASASGFTPTTSGVVSVVEPGVSLANTLPATTTALSADSPFTAWVGPPLPDGSGFYTNQLTGYGAQAIRAGGVARTVTLQSDTPAVGFVKTLTGSAPSVEVTIPVGASQTANSVDAGGVAFDPASPGLATVSASIPGFVTTTPARQTVTVTAAGMAVYSPYPGPALQEFPRYLGAGLQEGPYWVVLGGSDHGGVTVRISSGNPLVLGVSPNADTPSTPFIDVPVADGQTYASFYAQGLEGQTGSTSVTAAAPGFLGTVSGVISVVTPAVSFLGGLPTSTTALSPSTPFYVYLGVPSDDSTTLRYQNYPGYLQAIRAGGTPRSVTVTSSDPSVGRVMSSTGTGASATVTIPVGSSYTDYAALQFVPVAPGDTTVSATIPGFVSVDSASTQVRVEPPAITVYSPYYYPAYQIFPRYVGAGLQDGPYWFTLSGSSHGGATVRVATSDSARALVSPDATTPGAAFIDVQVPDGQTTASFFVQGVENASGDVTVTVSESRFVEGVSGTITVAAPGYRLLGLPASVSATDDTFVFSVELGIPSAGNTDLIEQVYNGFRQALRPRPLPEGTPLTVTVTNDNPTASQLVTASGGRQTWAISILRGESASSGSVATGGIAFDALSGSCTDVGCDTFVEATIPGWIKTQQATRLVRVTP